jgi:hypothetical protein
MFVYLMQFNLHNNKNHPEEFVWFHRQFPECNNNCYNYFLLTNILKWDKVTVNEFNRIFKLYQNIDKFIYILQNSSPWLSSKFDEQMRL